MATPTIFKGDDSGEITLTMATGRVYTGATLYATYQNVTREFTDLTPGGSVALRFSDDETSRFALGTYPIVMRIVGSAGAVETVENAAAKIKVTDCLADVNAGGSFIVTPAEQGAEGKATKPTTGALDSNSNVDEIITKINTLLSELKS